MKRPVTTASASVDVAGCGRAPNGEGGGGGRAEGCGERGAERTALRDAGKERGAGSSAEDAERVAPRCRRRAAPRSTRAVRAATRGRVASPCRGLWRAARPREQRLNRATRAPASSPQTPSGFNLGPGANTGRERALEHRVNTRATNTAECVGVQPGHNRDTSRATGPLFRIWGAGPPPAARRSASVTATCPPHTARCSGVCPFSSCRRGSGRCGEMWGFRALVTTHIPGTLSGDLGYSLVLSGALWCSLVLSGALW